MGSVLLYNDWCLMYSSNYLNFFRLLIVGDLTHEGIPNPKVGHPFLTLDHRKCCMLRQVIRVAIWKQHIKKHCFPFLWLHIESLSSLSIQPSRKRGFAWGAKKYREYYCEQVWQPTNQCKFSKKDDLPPSSTSFKYKSILIDLEGWYASLILV